jgi:hypothetical protein
MSARQQAGDLTGGLMSLQTSNPSSHRCLSYADSIATMWQDFLLLVGRIMLGWIFFQSGWGKIGNIAGYAKSFPRRGLESDPFRLKHIRHF